ncbi:hypothetical protein [Burkholderia lata]|uniref:hypothetical protein n=1 Tax=Burkholderia lata (strain ATCC 17760 / DSM 23089 / LMG 22485 / NCIMB 9086 / R18194 / 383) TaxID=482957 RepID=UPI00399B5AAA
MNPGPIENWFALPPPRAASYLPAPYGVRHGVTDCFARSLPGEVYLSNRRLAVAADACAADYGHDNLAWSSKPPPRGRGRLVSAAIGGAVFGAALMALLGAVMADRGAELGHAARGGPAAGSRASESVVAVAPETAPAPPPAPVSDAMSALAPPPAPVSDAMPALAPPPAPASDTMPALAPPRAPMVSQADVSSHPVRGANEHAVPALRPTPHRRPDRGSVRTREPEVVRPVSAQGASRRVPTKPRPAGPADLSVSGAPDRCGADWPCGDALRALQVELKHWEARQQLPAAVESHTAEAPVRLTDHRRVTEW